MTEITADLPKTGISVPTGQQILLQTNYSIEDAIFTWRAPRIVDKVKPGETKLNLKPTGPDINLVPWEVFRDFNDPLGSLRVKGYFGN